MSVEVLRESACDCIHEIIMKGMEPLAKKELVESLLSVLEKSSILEPQEVKWLFMCKRNIFVQDCSFNTQFPPYSQGWMGECIFLFNLSFESSHLGWRCWLHGQVSKTDECFRITASKQLHKVRDYWFANIISRCVLARQYFRETESCIVRKQKMSTSSLELISQNWKHAAKNKT